MPLSARQQQFVAEYLVDLNATQAAIRAGYSERTAAQQAARLLTIVKVRQEIDRLIAERARELDVTARNVLQEYARLAFSDIGQVLDFSGEELSLLPANRIPVAARRAIASVKVKRQRQGRGPEARTVEFLEFKLWPKTEALQAVARHLGLLKDRESAGLNVFEHLSKLTDEQLRHLEGIVAAITGANPPPPGQPTA